MNKQIILVADQPNTVGCTECYFSKCSPCGFAVNAMETFGMPRCNDISLPPSHYELTTCKELT